MAKPDAQMKRDDFPPAPAQRADYHVGVVTCDRDDYAVFHGRTRLVLFLDFEQCLELQRCCVAAMQTKFVGEELLTIELEPGVLELLANREG